MTLHSERILGLARFERALAAIALRSTTADLPRLRPATEVPPVDWNYALMCASALTAIDEEPAQDAVLRVAQGCLRQPGITEEQRSAAVLLLGRVGNQLAIDLARTRNLLPGSDLPVSSPMLSLDAARRRMDLTLETLGGTDVLTVNPFQKAFWDTIQSSSWVSVSAPTSAGKSHIVREWLRDRLSDASSIKIVYLAPTRALVEEVSASLRRDLGRGLGVHTLPWDQEIAAFERQVFVMTQERLHLLLYRLPSLAPDVVFVDEAQKIGEGTRGILLSQVLDEVVRRNSSVKVVFASPLSENPEVLLEPASDGVVTSALVGESVTVNQALIFAKQAYRHPKEYDFVLAYRGQELELGRLQLVNAPGGDGRKVPVLAAALGAASGGNLVYANGPAEAEKYAKRIFDELGPEAESDDPRLQELVDFASGVVHERFLLATVVRRGVAYHYGDMPLVLKAKVESLFRQGVIRFLVCTSTLLEGVNLPCKNIFMRAPRKGASPMSMGDFWNLSGRAGRWGQEFQGNIVCIDVDNPRAWPERPGMRKRSTIEPVARTVFRSHDSLVSYVVAGGPKASREVAAELESVFSWMAGRTLEGTDLRALYSKYVDAHEVPELDLAVQNALDGLTIDARLIRKHAGISPLSIERLYRAVLDHGRPDLLALVPPASDDAFDEYKVALDFVAEYLGGSFEPENRRRSLARLIVHWMRGVPLRVIIDNRARNRRQRGMTVVYPQLIRKVMEDVEDIARFEAPRYLACYSDVVAAAASALGTANFPSNVEIDMMLELGVPRITEMAMISLGLSRATTMAISEQLVSDAMTPAACADWILHSVPEELDIPRFAVRELADVQDGLRLRAPEI